MPRVLVSSRTVILTRPGDRNQALMSRLTGAGLCVIEAPALRLEPMPCSREDLPLPQSVDLVMFVSGHAADFYLQACRRSHPHWQWPDTVQAACVGQSTAWHLVQSGRVPPTQIICPFWSPVASPSDSLAVRRVNKPLTEQDSEALWHLLEPMCSHLQRVLIVRGDTGRNWLTEKLQSQGVEVLQLPLYRRVPAQWAPDLQSSLSTAFHQPVAPLVVLTSRESVDAFMHNVLCLTDMSVLEGVLFIAIHPRIATHLKQQCMASGMVKPPMVQLSAPDNESLFTAICALSSPVPHS